MCSSGRVRFNDVSVSNWAQSYADYENISPPDVDLRHVMYFRKRRVAYSGMHDLFEEKSLLKGNYARPYSCLCFDRLKNRWLLRVCIPVMETVSRLNDIAVFFIIPIYVGQISQTRRSLVAWLQGSENWREKLSSRMVWLSSLLIRKKPQVTVSRIHGIPAKIPAIAHPLAEEPVEIASNINYHMQYSLHFFSLQMHHLFKNIFFWRRRLLSFSNQTSKTLI